MEAAAELVVHAAARHAVERQLDHLERVGVAGPGVVPEQEVERHGLWELRRGAEPSVLVVESVAQPRVCQGHGVPGQRRVVRERLSHAAHRRCDLLRGAGHVGASRPVRVRDGGQNTRETGHAVAILGREVGAAVERLSRGREEHGKGPAAAAGHGLDCAHVDGVDVRALLTVNLHVDKGRVHKRRDVGVLERLTLHDVAPVARGVADA